MSPPEETEELPAPKRPRPKNKRIWASLVQDPLAVIADAFSEALLRDEEMSKTWVVLVDGDAHQLGRIDRVAEDFGVEIFRVLDIIHVIERLWGAAGNLFETGDEAAGDWVCERLLRLLQGEVSGVAAGMRRSATCRGLSKKERKGIDGCASYLLKYKGTCSPRCGYEVVRARATGRRCPLSSSPVPTPP